MAAKPRVHKVAAELGIDSKVALRKLRDLGEFVKSPSSTIEPPVARKLRAAILADERRAGTSTHPDAIAAEARRAIIRRTDSDWEGYGFTAADKKRWVDAGVPENKAHIAAMCRDSEKRGSNPSRLMPANLRRRLGDARSSERVIDVLLGGTNAIRAQNRLASQMGADITGVNSDLLRLTVSGKSGKLPPESTARDLGRAFRGLHWIPQNAVTIADSAADIIDCLVPLTRAHSTLRGQIDQYRRDRAVAPLLAAYARAHGVFRSGALLDALCDAHSDSTALYVSALSAADLIRRAVDGRRFFFLRADAVGVLDGVAPRSADVVPPSPEGVALLAQGEDSKKFPARFVFWVTGSNGDIRCLLVNAAQVASVNLSRLLAWGQRVETWEVSGERAPENRAAAFLDALSVRRSRPLGQSRARSSDSHPVTEPGSESTVLRDVVVAYYPRDTGASSSGASSRRSPDHRWVVRGHWRRQWYPREGAHRPVWIQEHESGPADHPLLLAERVEVH